MTQATNDLSIEELAVAQRALELACDDIEWTVSLNAPMTTPRASTADKVSYYTEWARKEIADDTSN